MLVKVDPLITMGAEVNNRTAGYNGDGGNDVRTGSGSYRTSVHSEIGGDGRTSDDDRLGADD